MQRLQFLNDNFGHLAGEKLTGREKIWKELKELDHVKGRDARQQINSGLFAAWTLLNHDKEGFVEKEARDLRLIHRLELAKIKAFRRVKSAERWPLRRR